MLADRRSALTLIELTVVLVILAVLAGLVVPIVTSASDHARYAATHATMARLRDVIMGQYRHDMSGLLPRAGDAVSLPGDPSGTNRSVPQLVFLFVNPGPTSTGAVNLSATTINPVINTTIAPASVPGSATVTYNPIASLGWRGPYLETGVAAKYPGTDPIHAATFDPTNIYGVNGDLTVLDGWNMPIVIQQTQTTVGTLTTTTTSLVSAGPDQNLSTTTDNIILNLYTR
jgi:prepilin-type N-terminal cleavage/methylation domain-containing protein